MYRTILTNCHSFISDDEGGEHYFRVFRDVESGAVRIAAFIKDDDLQDLPVWTAFSESFLFLNFQTLKIYDTMDANWNCVCQL